MKTHTYRVEPGQKVHAAELPTTADHPGGKEAAQAETAELTARLAELQDLLVAEGRHRILVVLQGRDTAGKDGAIRHVFAPLDPLGVRTVAFGVPTEPELAHDYLWRVHSQVPADGEIVLFNRSHYEDVLVVRTHELVPKARWSKRFEHIRAFEQLLVDEGTTIVKLFLNISRDEQRARLQARLDEPDKRWKFNPGDLRDRELWDAFDEAYSDALSATSTHDAPWYAVPADQKWFRDRLVAQIMVETLEGLEMRYPPDPEGLDRIVIDGTGDRPGGD